MENFKSKLASSKRPYHTIAYCLSFLGIGAIITGLGPLIPYLSQISGRQQTQYSLLFLGRSIGFIIGGLTMKFIEKYFNFHQILVIGCISTFICLICFSFTNDIYYQTFFFMMTLIGLCWKGIIINITLLKLQKDNEQQFWVLFSQGIFGIGGLIGPIFVSFFETNCFLFIGLWMFCISFFYFRLQTPENHQQITLKINNESMLEEIKGNGFSQTFQDSKQQSQIKRNPLTYQMEIILCVMCFLQFGIQTSFGGWISPYSVLQNVSNKEQATKFTSYYWLFMTICRFITSSIDKKTSQKFNFLIISFIGSSFIILIFINFEYFYASCVLSSFLFGVCMSCYYGLILSLPGQFNIQITAKHNGTFMIFASFGQGILSMLTGYLMAWISLNMLFYIILIGGIALKISLNMFIHQAKKLLTIQSQKKENDYQLLNAKTKSKNQEQNIFHNNQ